MQAVFSTKAVCEAGCKQDSWQKITKLIGYGKSVAHMYIVYLSFTFSCIMLWGNITTVICTFSALFHSDLKISRH